MSVKREKTPWVYTPFLMVLSFVIWLKLFWIESSVHISPRNTLISPTNTSIILQQDPIPQEETPQEKEYSESTDSFAFLLLLGMEIISFLIGYIIKQTHFHYLQEVGAIMIFGAIVGALIRFISVK